MSMRYKGGIISATPPTTSQSSAGGVWTLEQQLQANASGAWPVNGPFWIEDVFSVYLRNYSSASSQTVTTNIDGTKGCLLWAKERVGAGYNHWLVDTARGKSGSYYKNLGTNTTAAEASSSAGFTAISSTGYTTDNGGGSSWDNASTGKHVIYQFRKQAKFFDVVTYTGNGTTQAINHNLGSTPGCVIVKVATVSSQAGGNWPTWHRGLSSGNIVNLNLTGAQGGPFPTYFGNNTTTVDPTSTQFTVGSNVNVNDSGAVYVAYLFAHDAGGFGAAGTDNVISCGSYTGNGSTQTVSLGYEPQFLMYKQATGTGGDWMMFDIMRGLDMSTSDKALFPNSSSAESGGDAFNPTATGFVVQNNAAWNASGQTYIYIAIRRGPMRTPTSGTSVFTPLAVTASTGTSRTIGFPADFIYSKYRDGSDSVVTDKLRGFLNANSINSPSLFTNTTGAENASNYPLAYNVWNTTALDGGYMNSVAAVFYYFRRAPGFFDVVCYTGTGAAANVSHNLGVVPELMIVKTRSTVDFWYVYHSAVGNTKYLQLQATSAPATSSVVWNNTTPTSSVFSTGVATSGSGVTHVAYLFATVTGVSKVGSYQGNGTSKTIDCGFTAGARFVMIKRTDSTGDWYVWDSARGIVAGNDPHLSLNTTAAEVTTDDSVDTDSSGFIVNQVAATNVNVNNATYIFLAIA
jgi:hypothetical protein